MNSLRKDKLKRTKGRPKKVKAPIESYPGPSLDECLSMDDATVSAAYADLGITPKPLIRYFPLEPLYLEDPEPTPAQVAEHKAEHDKRAQQVRRIDLFDAYLTRWIELLAHTEIVRQIEARTGETIPETSLRYTAVQTRQDQLNNFLFAEAVEGSALYRPPV